MCCRFKMRSLFLVPTLAAACLAMIAIPTHRAHSFVSAFKNDNENCTLHWLEPAIQSEIHCQSEINGLRSNSCSHFQAVLEPPSIEEIFHFRRTIRLRHCGDWNLIVSERIKSYWIDTTKHGIELQPSIGEDVVVTISMQGLTVVHDLDRND